MGNTQARFRSDEPHRRRLPISDGTLTLTCSECGHKGSRPVGNTPKDACAGHEYHTKCYWYKADDQKTVTETVTEGPGETSGNTRRVWSRNVKIVPGSPCILFCSLASAPEVFYCNPCFARKHNVIIRSCMLELCTIHGMKFVAENLPETDENNQPPPPPDNPSIRRVGLINVNTMQPEY